MEYKIAIKVLESKLINGRLRQTIARLIGKPGSLRFRLARDTVGVMVIRALSMGLGFAVSVVLARLLRAAGYGIYAYVWSVVTFLSVPATFGLPQLLIRDIAAFQTKERWGHIKGLLHFAHRIVLVASLVLAVLLGLGTWFFSDHIGVQTSETFLMALPLLVLMALFQISQFSLQGLGRIVQGQALASVARPTLFIILVIGAYFVLTERITPPLAMGMQVVAFGVVFFAGTHLLKKYLPEPVKRTSSVFEIRPWLRSALFFLTYGVLGIITQQSAILLLGPIKGAEEVGIYRVVLQTASLILFPSFSLNTVMAPIISRLFATGKNEHLQRMITYAVRVASLFAFALVIGFVAWGGRFLAAVFGREFARGAPALAILSVGNLINVAIGPVGLILNMTGYERIVVWGYGLGAVVNLLLGTVLIPFLGVEGAAIASAISTLMWNLTLMVKVLEKVTINPTLIGRVRLKPKSDIGKR